MYRKARQLPKFYFKEESYWQLLMGVTRYVESAQGKFFTPTFNYHVSCKEGVTKGEKCNTQRKLGYPKVERKTGP